MPRCVTCDMVRIKQARYRKLCIVIYVCCVYNSYGTFIILWLKNIPHAGFLINWTQGKVVSATSVKMSIMTLCPLTTDGYPSSGFIKINHRYIIRIARAFLWRKRWLARFYILWCIIIIIFCLVNFMIRTLKLKCITCDTEFEDSIVFGKNICL
jgi:hypothetical protein